MTVLNAILPVITLALGYVGTLITESKRDTRARDRAAAEAQQANSARRAERRDSYELWILDRADAQLADFARVCGRMHFVDSQEAKTSGRYMGTTLPEGLSDAFFVANQRIRRTISRVPDDDIRTATLAAVNSLSRPSQMVGGTVDQAEQAMQKALIDLQAAHEAIGARIRELVAAGATTPEVSPEYHEQVIGPSGLLKAPR